MCHCSTSEDVELGLLRFSLCLPGAGGIPKPRTPGDQQVAWLVNPASLDADPSTPEDSGWICGMYARAWARLEMAIYGQDVEDSQEIAFCYGDAVTFAACLPFYGFTIGSLQYAVRSYFGLEGTRRQDLSDGCCFPRDTILRNEQEIILRERLRKAPEEKQQPPYGCYDQMLYQSQSQSEQKQQRAVRGDQAQVPTSENKAEATSANVKTTPAKVHSVHEDVRQPSQPNRRAPHALEEDLATPSKAKRQEHILHDDAETATPAKPVPHELGATSLKTGPL
ncbi:hypothetical protein GGI42DRAFT_265510 [Trichoderma sp. SZMC 28013]